MAEVITRLNCDKTANVVIPSNHITSASSTIPKSLKTSKNLNDSSFQLSSFNVEHINNDSFQTSKILNSKTSKNFRSPRCEAFVMTGDKMLNLNPKISPHYAKMRHDQLPPSSEIYDGELSIQKQNLFDEFSTKSQTAKRSNCIIKNNSKSESSEKSSTQEDLLLLISDKDISKSHTKKMIKNKHLLSKNNTSNTSCKTNSASTLPDASDLDVDKSKTLADLSRKSSIVLQKNKSPSIISKNDINNSRLLASSTTGNSNFSLKNKYANNDELSEKDVSINNFKPILKNCNNSNEHLIVYNDKLINMAIPKPETISRIATQLFFLENGYTLDDVATFLNKKDCPLFQQVTTEFLQFFNFSGKRLDVALREFLNHVSLTGETSERAHFLMHFSQRYFECNPTIFNNIDEIHALACALILLHTDLHGPNLGKKMTAREFVDNLLHTKYTYDRNMLKTLFNAIKNEPFASVPLKRNSVHTLSSNVPSNDSKNDCFLNASRNAPAILSQDGHCLSRISNTMAKSGDKNIFKTNVLPKRKKRKITMLNKKSVILLKNETVFANPLEQIDYKRGWLLKKTVYDSDGQRTPFGRRKWQMYYATLRGMVLYLHKNERVFECSQHEIFANCIRLHHSVAEVALDYKKRQHVFRLRTANLGEILFQTSESQEVQKWIDAINYVAAAFSTPVLPAPVSSADYYKPKFYLPQSLPVLPTTFSMSEQLRAHCDRLEEMNEALAKLRLFAPSIKAKGRPVYEYFYHERYLDKERERYQKYVSILKEKLSAASQIDIFLLTSSMKKNFLAVNNSVKNHSNMLQHNYNKNNILDNTSLFRQNNVTSSQTENEKWQEFTNNTEK